MINSRKIIKNTLIVFKRNKKKNNNNHKLIKKIITMIKIIAKRIN